MNLATQDVSRFRFAGGSVSNTLAVRRTMMLAQREISAGPSLPKIAAKPGGRMYAIAFDMDIEALRVNYGDPYNNAYLEIRKILQRHGFNWQQGSMYFGGESINAVTCVLAAIDLSAQLEWFAASVRDIRMLRIEEFNDLMPAVQQSSP